MNLKKSQDRIEALMIKFVTTIEGAGAMGNTDINRKSEDALIPLLSEIYGHKDLKNLNVSEGSHFPAIDLGDEKTGTAYQITSTANSEKIKDTLSKFVKHELYKKYDHLVIYILKKKQKTYEGRGFDEIIQDKFTFDKGRDILDYRDLLKEISGFSLDKLRVIESILEEHFGDPEYTRPLDPLDWLEKVNNLWGEEPATIKINREKLRNDLQDFALRGNGVIIGSPGVGKTYLLKKLRQSLKSDEIPHLLLPIDQLGNGTDETLRQELSYESDLIDKLKSIPVSAKKGILLFDAFDAARNEESRRRFLRLIRRAIQELNGLWNVVVTVRTYDAEKSQELLDLFGNPYDTDLPQYHSQGILCRHFTIFPLNEEEIRQAFDQIQSLKRIYNAGSPEFKELLANPFSLWLLEKILKSPEDVHALSQIHSEVQLLGLFWQRRVEVTSNEVHRLPVLTQIVRQMVNDHSLTVRLDNIDSDLDLDQAARKAAWAELQSDEILVRVSSTRQRIAFSHDILFDYAVSVLLIDDEPRQLEDFIRKDPSRPLFLRPSLTYFFTRLWYDAPENFWNAFWHIFPSNQSLHFRLVARLIPTSVVANETREIDQLTPLLEKLQNGETVGNETIARLLQLLHVLEIERDPLWIDFFDQVSEHLHPDFAWDLATLTSEILDRAKPEDRVVIKACGRIGRKFLEWIWQERENDWYERLGFYCAVPLVAKTYSTNVEESRKLLEKVLALRRVGHFSMDALMQLVYYIDKIWDDDPEFVGLIYSAGIIGDRRQGGKTCHYWLVQHFPDFLRASPLLAAQTAIESLNGFMIGTDYQHELVDENMDGTFDFRGKLACLVTDNSFMWNERKMHSKPAEMAETLFEFIEELADSEDSLLDSVLDIFRDYVRAEFFWKGLLRKASQSPEIFAPHLLELFAARPIQMNDRVFYELCTFLRVAASEFTVKQQLQVEDAICNLPRKEPEENYRACFEQRRNQLLAEIPQGLLLTDVAKEIREEMERENAVPENRPPVNIGDVPERYTDEERLQDQEINTTTPENQEVHYFFESLDKFCSDWKNRNPTEEATASILRRLREGYTTIREDTGADKAAIDLLWCKLTACAAILARVADNPEGHLFIFCRQVLLDAASHELPKPDPELDAQFNSAIYSPFPRHEASMGLLSLIDFHADAKLLDAIEKLARDPVPSVRMVTAERLFIVYDKAPKKFWHIMGNRARYETNHVVQDHLYATLAWTVAASEEETTRIMDRLLKRTPLPTDPRETELSCIDLLMRLAIDCENAWALEIIENSFFKYPIRFTECLSYAVSQVVREYVAPQYLKRSGGGATTKRSINWLSRVVTVTSGGIEELCAAFAEPRTEEVREQLAAFYGVIEEVILQLSIEFVPEVGRSENPVEKISNELRCRFYSEVKPLMRQIVNFALDTEKGVMFAPAASNFIRFIVIFLSCNPKEVLHLVKEVARSSKQSGYSFDSLAVRAVVKLVEIVLADHRSEVREGEGLEDLLKLLDIFIEAGWSDAIGLVWRLDEVFR